MAARGSRRARRLQDTSLTVQEMVNTAWGLAQVVLHHPELFESIAAAVQGRLLGSQKAT